MFKLNNRKNFNSGGFSLIEVVVAITILAIAFIGLVQSFPLGMSINTSARQKTSASYLAQSKIESLHSLNYDNIATGTIEVKQRLSNDPSNYLYNFQRETEVDYVDGDLNEVSYETGLKKITAKVYYINRLKKEEDKAELSTLISKH